MGEAQTRNRRKQDAGANRPEVAAPKAPTPGLDAVQALGAAVDSAEAIVEQIRRHPMERDEILEWLQQHRGNTFTKHVVSQLGDVERLLPEGVSLKKFTGGFTVPGGMSLAGDWKANVKTRNPTGIQVEVSPTGVAVSFTPGMFVDALWPLQNARIVRAGVRFADGKPFAEVHDVNALGHGFISITEQISNTITGLLAQGIAGTPYGQSYGLVQDPDLGETLKRVIDGFKNMFADKGDKEDKDGAGGKRDAPDLTGREMERVHFGATVASDRGGDYVNGGNGVHLDAGAELSVSVETSSNMRELVDARSVVGAANTADVKSVRFRSSGVQVIAKGKPIVSITQFTLSPGGRVSVDEMHLLGEAKDAKRTEAGLSLLVGLLAHSLNAGHTSRAAYANATNPEFVEGVSRGMIENELTSQFARLVMQYRHVVPGMDLAQILRMN